jgi:amino acid transporter
MEGENEILTRMGKSNTFRRSLGLVELVSLGVGGTIGSGIFVVPGVAARLSGPASLAAWIIVAVSASCVLLSLTYVAFRFTATDSFYSLFESIFGSRIAVPLILLYLVSAVFGVATIAAGIGQYLSYFGVTAGLLIETCIIAVFCGLNITGVSLAGKTENVLTILKTIPLILIAFLLLPLIKPENFALQSPVTATAILGTVIIVYWPFTGFEISAIPVEETKDPGHIRRSLLIVMTIVVSVYLLLNIALIGSIGSAALAGSPAPVAAAAGVLFPYSGTIVAFIGIVAMLSAMNAYILATSRVLHNIAARFAVPRVRDLNRNGTPAVAIVVGCLASAGLLFFSNNFALLATGSVIATLIPYIFFCIAAWILVPDVKVRMISAIGACSTAAILILYFVV